MGLVRSLDCIVLLLVTGRDRYRQIRTRWPPSSGLSSSRRGISCPHSHTWFQRKQVAGEKSCPARVRNAGYGSGRDTRGGNLTDGAVTLTNHSSRQSARYGRVSSAEPARVVKKGGMS